MGTDNAAADPDFTLIGLLETRDEPECGCLSATTGSQQGKYTARLHGKIQARYRLDSDKAFRDSNAL